MPNTQSEILHLDRNENLYGPAPKCFDVLRDIAIEELSTYPRDFVRGVKSKLSERLASDFGISESQILLSEGSEDMLKQTVHCYLSSGEKILCPAQSWWYYQKVAGEVSGITVNYALEESRDSFAYDVTEIIDAYKENSPKILLIASPNNPTGNSVSPDEFVALMSQIDGTIVILDEAYWGFNSRTNESLLSLVNRFDNLLILRTFSKYYALAGARIGFAAAGKGLTQLVQFASRYLGHNRVSEALALAALDSPNYYRQVAENIRYDREKYYDLFSRFEGFRCYRSDANFVLVKIPAELKSPLKRFLGEQEIAVKFFDEGEFSSYIRITMGTVEQNRRLMKTLNTFLEVWKTCGVHA